MTVIYSTPSSLRYYATAEESACGNCSSEPGEQDSGHGGAHNLEAA